MAVRRRRQCLQCGTWFEISPRAARTDRVFCSDACRFKAYRERQSRARRMHALADFVAEHGERGLRALGGRREAERWLSEQDAGLDVPALMRGLEQRAPAAS